MKLYGSRLSPFVERVILAAKLKGIEGEIELAYPPGGLKSDDYLAISPLGKVPALEEGDFRLPESQVICDYLEERFPQTLLLPEDPEARARIRLICRLVDLYAFDGLVPLFGQAPLPEADRDAALIADSLAKLETALNAIEAVIRPIGRAHGDDWSLADCALVPLFFYLQLLMPGFGADPTQGRPKLHAWLNAMADEELVKESNAAMREAVRTFRAQS